MSLSENKRTIKRREA